MKLLVITRCSTCPFFEDSPLKRAGGLGGLFIAALLSETQYGICTILPSGEFLPTADLKIGLPRPSPERDLEEPRLLAARQRRVVDDKRTIPEDCPLRKTDITISITKEN